MWDAHWYHLSKKFGSRLKWYTKGNNELILDENSCRSPLIANRGREVEESKGFLPLTAVWEANLQIPARGGSRSSTPLWALKMGVHFTAKKINKNPAFVCWPPSKRTKSCLGVARWHYASSSTATAWQAVCLCLYVSKMEEGNCWLNCSPGIQKSKSLIWLMSQVARTASCGEQNYSTSARLTWLPVKSRRYRFKRSQHNPLSFQHFLHQ